MNTLSRYCLIYRTLTSQHMLARTMLNVAFGAWLLSGGAAGAAAQEQAALPPKLSNMVRIGIVKPQVQMGAEEDSTAAESVRLILAEYLQGPTIEVALLSSRLASQYAIEAAQGDCDFVLSVSLTHERSRMTQALGRALDKVAVYAPRVSSGDIASAVVTGVIYSAADFAASIRARDELQIGYRLETVGRNDEPVVTDNLKRRAKSDGEDLLTPLVEATAEAIGAALVERRTGAP